MQWFEPIPTVTPDYSGIGPYDEAVTPWMIDCGVPGCAYGILFGDRILTTRAFGWAEIDKAPFRLNTLCRIASVSKTITGIAVLALVQDGALNLDDLALPILRSGGIEPFVPQGAEMDSGIARITVRHLLDQTSGLVDGPYKSDYYICDALGLLSPVSARNVVRYLLGTMRLVSEPGEKYAYYNGNFVALGRIIEAVTGREYEQYVRERVLAPLGIGPDEIRMSHTFRASDSPERNPSEAFYYQSNPLMYDDIHHRGGLVPEAEGGLYVESMDAGGGWCASITGLAKFAGGLVSADCPILDEHGMAELRTPPSYLADAEEMDGVLRYYSKGVMVTRRRTESGFTYTLGHSGMMMHNGACIIQRPDGYTFVLVGNFNFAEGPYLDAQLREVLFRVHDSLADEGRQVQ